MKIRSRWFLTGLGVTILLGQSGLLCAQTGTSATGAATTSPSAAATGGLYRSTWSSAYRHLILAAPDQTITEVNAALTQMPKAPGLYLLRAAAEAQQKKWTAASADCSQAETYNLAPELRGLEASVLAGSPDPHDRQNAVENAHVALGLAGNASFNEANLAAGVMALRRLQTPEEFLTALQTTSSDGAQRWQALATYLATLEDPAKVTQFSRGLTMGIDLPLPKSGMTVSQMLDQAIKLFGDQPALDLDRVNDDLLKGQTETAVEYGRQHQKLHPGAVDLANTVHIAEARRALQLLQAGDAAQATSTLEPPVPGHPDRPEIAILRARILSAQGQYKIALAELMQASLQSQPADVAGLDPYQDLLAFLVNLPSGTAMQSRDLLYWQGLIAFEAGDYSTAASAMQYSDQVSKWIDPKADYILALSQEKAGQQAAARASWSRMLEHSRYTVYQGYAVAGLRRTGGHATIESRSSYNTIEGSLTSIDCHNGKPYGVTIVNGSVEYPARVTEAILVRGHLPHHCGLLITPVWVVGMLRPVEADMPLYAGVATELRADPQRRWMLSPNGPGRASRRIRIVTRH